MTLSWLNTEWEGFRNSSPENIFAEPVDNDMFHWHGKITGPSETPFEGGGFIVDIVCFRGKKELMSPSSIYFLIAERYRSLQHYDRAIFYLEKCLAYQLQDSNEYAYTLWLIAMIYYHKKEYLMVISKCKIAVTLLHNSQFIDHKKLADCYNYTAMSYDELENHEYCFIYSKQAIKHFLLCDSVDYNSIGQYLFEQFKN
jgi:tetratricopeptide (TPR) repeat protein